MATAYLGIGSNIEAERNIQRGLALLAQAVRVTALSTLYRTPAQDRPDDPPFTNAVAAVETALSPRALKEALRSIEEAVGRRRAADKYAPRTLDLDIIWYDNNNYTDDAVMLPDPEISHRPFLAIPLAELAPELILPNGMRVRDVAVSFHGAVLEPLPALTAQLRKDLRHESQTR
jgi:2-amino-4-hydroxy-6-hydroxymethyldihydropteridine diphosphokinase